MVVVEVMSPWLQSRFGQLLASSSSTLNPLLASSSISQLDERQGQAGDGARRGGATRRWAGHWVVGVAMAGDEDWG